MNRERENVWTGRSLWSILLPGRPENVDEEDVHSEPGEEDVRGDSEFARALEERPSSMTRDDSEIARALAGRQSTSEALVDRISTHSTSELLHPKLVEKKEDVSFLDHRSQLQRHLADFDLAEHAVTGDGACQFRAIAHQIYGDESKHAEVRAKVVAVLKKQRKRYGDFVVDASYDVFLKRMSKPNEWGDHLTLQAAADHYRMRICLVTSYRDKPFLHLVPSGLIQHTHTIWLSFWAEVHYNSIATYTDARLHGPIIVQ